MRSISTRLTIGNSVVLAVFVVLIAFSVSYSVHQRAETARFDSLRGLVYGILGAAEINDQAQLSVNPLALPDGRLSSLSSGLFAEIVGNGGDKLWQSASVTTPMPPTVIRPIGDWLFEAASTEDFENLHRLQLSIAWQLADGEELPFIVHVADQGESLARQLKRFDRTLWATLLGSALLLLIVQWVVLRFSLRPLYGIGEQVAQIERGERDTVDKAVPHELSPLTSGLNALLAAERERHAQYRHLLGDLSHSLKTPLSVLQNIAHSKTTQGHTTQGHKIHGAAAQSDESLGQSIIEQTDQMKASLARYSQRANFKSPRYLAPVITVKPLIDRIVNSLGKLYGPDKIEITLNVAHTFTVRMDEADLLEVVGNILENACRYGATSIVLDSSSEERTIVVDDNGPGFSGDEPEVLLQRGVRADSQKSGTGMGLAASDQLMRNYGGSIDLSQSLYGGARVILRFP